MPLIQHIPERKRVFENKMRFKKPAYPADQPAVDEGAENGSPLHSDKSSKENQRQDHAQNTAAAIVNRLCFTDGQTVLLGEFLDE